MRQGVDAGVAHTGPEDGKQDRESNVKSSLSCEARVKHEGHHQRGGDREIKMRNQFAAKFFVFLDVVEQIGLDDAYQHLERDQGDDGENKECDIDSPMKPLISHRKGDERTEQHYRHGSDSHLEDQNHGWAGQHVATR